jgi:hypothetical protein
MERDHQIMISEMRMRVKKNLLDGISLSAGVLGSCVSHAAQDSIAEEPVPSGFACGLLSPLAAARLTG